MLDMIGQRVKRIRFLTAAEMAREGWEDEARGTAIELEDGTVLFASRDDEGNGPGALFGYQGSTPFRVQAEP